MRPERTYRPTNKAFKDMTGQKYGMATVTDYWCKDGKAHHLWECICDCGNDFLARGNNLKTGNTISCGCQHSGGRAVERHGMHKSKEYSTWQHMRNRCNDPKNKKYPLYGGRGIKPCERWNSFDAFLEDMGEMPEWASSLDRIDPDKGYFKENCRWADVMMQNRNLRTVVKVEYNGETVVLNELAERMGLTPACVKSRIRRGASLEEALRTK